MELEIQEIKTVGDIRVVYREAGLSEPHISRDNLFEDAEILQKLLNRITELEAQRNELLEACKELTIESANYITNKGHDGIEANSDNIHLIERITGKIWQDI